MDYPFLGNAWYASSRPRYGQSFRKVPVEVHPKPTTPPPQFVKPQVVSIPVNFVESERSRPDPSHSAVKIQKVFRGFWVRKNMKKIKAIMMEVNAIERRVSHKEVVDFIRNDSKERLKVYEMLMSLLLKLDSVRGVDTGVRNYRKSVIKKAIALQERIDAIVSGEQSPDSNNADSGMEVETVDRDRNINDCNQTQEPQTNAIDPNEVIYIPSDDCDQTLEPQTDAVDQIQGINDSSDNCNQASEPQAHDEVTNDADFMPDLSESEVIPQNQETVDSSKEMGATQEEEDRMETSRTESQTDSSANPENVDVEEVESKGEEAALDENENCLPDVEKEEDNKSNKEDSGENKTNKELFARMVEDNEKMMRLMTQLFQRNEEQTRLLSALSQRVERLEKAFLCDKLRRKKRSATGSGDCCDVKKCGKR